MFRRGLMQTQPSQLKGMSADNTYFISTLGRDHPEGTLERRGRNWQKHQACQDDTFLLNVLEGYSTGESCVFTRQERYIKINFWLAGKHTTILDNFREHEHDGPEVFITSGPPEMTKIDLFHGNSNIASVALCVLRDFFPLHMGLPLDELPEPLRQIVVPESTPYAFHRLALTPDLATAAASILTAPFAVRQQPVYRRAKGIELMCLLIERMQMQARRSAPSAGILGRRESRLHEARELLALRYADNITLEGLSREVGLNRMALSAGFRQLFGMSVYDCLLKERMEHAYRLLQEGSSTIAQVAEAVGYAHHCNFSTAFREHFGCTPQKVRQAGRRS